jgi:3-oxoacyl-[acyl-carrier-protein] synthase-3
VNLLFQNRAITGLLLVVPANERLFMEEMKAFHASPVRSLKLKEVMGYDRHRLVTEGVCTSDLVVQGFEHLFREGLVIKDDIDALVLVTQCPDYFVPPTSSVIQGRLGLKQDMFCLDINQGCTGFVMGLMQAFLLLEQPAIQCVALVTADVLSRKVSPRDRNSYPLIGDAAAITMVQRKPDTGPIHANLKMDGTKHHVLRIPAGGFRMPSTSETAVMEDAGDGNFRAKDHLCMDGSEVFNFVMNEVPPMVEKLLQQAGVPREAVDYFMFHQPNRFMLQKLADKLGVPRDRVPSNVVERYGNSNSVTIPAAMALNASDRLVAERLRICFAGFGVGLTWASMLMNVGPLAFCRTVEYP